MQSGTLRVTCIDQVVYIHLQYNPIHNSKLTQQEHIPSLHLTNLIIREPKHQFATPFLQSTYEVA